MQGATSDRQHAPHQAATTTASARTKDPNSVQAGRPPPADSTASIDRLRRSGHEVALQATMAGRAAALAAVPPAFSLKAFLHEGVKLVADLGRVVDDRAAAAFACLLNGCHVGFLNRK
jgi:hypothetical protein